MRIWGLIAATAMLAACGDNEDGRAGPPDNRSRSPEAQPKAPPAADGAPAPKPNHRSSEVGGQPAPPPPGAPASPCLSQEGERLAVAPLRAVGTEPFWGARIEGRCVTYSHPDDQKGTRVWTRYRPAPGGGSWSGSLGGRRFELEIRSRPGCSDGMSDRRYPLEASLLVGGEKRSGCAEPL